MYPGIVFLGIGIFWRRFECVWGVNYCFGDAELHCGKFYLICDWPWVSEWLNQIKTDHEKIAYSRHALQIQQNSPSSVLVKQNRR